MSTPSDRDLLKMSAARLREQADMLDQVAGEFNEMSRLDEVIAWVRERTTYYRLNPHAVELLDECLAKLLALKAGK